jgi:hypothetical protein
MAAAGRRGEGVELHLGKIRIAVIELHVARYCCRARNPLLAVLDFAGAADVFHAISYLEAGSSRPVWL